MRQKRNRLGSEEKPPRPPNNAAAHVREEYPYQLAIWLECKDTCINAIYESVLNVPDALEIVEQYMLEKKILPTADPQNEPLAGLINRFRSEIQDELGDLNKILLTF